MSGFSSWLLKAPSMSGKKPPWTSYEGLIALECAREARPFAKGRTENELSQLVTNRLNPTANIVHRRFFLNYTEKNYTTCDGMR
jgi:hypothetical protein